MYIDYDRLAGEGYDVNPDKRGVTITPQIPLQLDWEDLTRQLQEAGVRPLTQEMARDAFHRMAEIMQLMEVLKD